MKMVKAGFQNYLSKSGRIRIAKHSEIGMWDLFEMDSEGNWQWCQRYTLLKDAKEGADWLEEQRR